MRTFVDTFTTMEELQSSPISKTTNKPNPMKKPVILKKKTLLTPFNQTSKTTIS